MYGPRWSRRIAVLLLFLYFSSLASLALAQGLGLGMGLQDQRGGKVVPVVPTFTLLNTASGKITLNGGGSLQCNAC